jgi:hypothetical protein
MAWIIIFNWKKGTSLLKYYYALNYPLDKNYIIIFVICHDQLLLLLLFYTANKLINIMGQCDILLAAIGRLRPIPFWWSNYVAL